MATRFYLPSSGTPPLASLAKDANWELETGLVRLPCYITKKNTALTTSQRTWASTTTQQWCWWQFQSPCMNAAYNWTTSDTVSMVLGKLAETTTGGDTHLNYCIRVVNADGTVIRGIIGALQATPGAEFALMASAATRIFNAATTGATTFSSQIGDRIIIEIGVHGITPALELIQQRIGDPTPTPVDFALTSGLTTDLVSWVELSRTVTFGNAPLSGISNGIASNTGIFKGKGRLYSASNGVATDEGILKGKGRLYGTTNGVATNTGNLTEAVSSSPIAGISNGIATNTGVLTAKGRLYGMSEGVTLSSGGINGKGILSGVISSVASVTGVLTGKGTLYSVIDTSSVLSGSIAGKGRLYSTIESISSLNGLLIGKGILTSSTNGVASVLGTITGSGRLYSEINTESSTEGVLKGIGLLSGSIQGMTSCSGLLNEPEGVITGIINGISEVSGILTGSGRLFGSCDSIINVGGTIGGKGDLKGEILTGASLSGLLSGVLAGAISGHISGHTSLTGMIYGITSIISVNNDRPIKISTPKEIWSEIGYRGTTLIKPGGNTGGNTGRQSSVRTVRRIRGELD